MIEVIITVTMLGIIASIAVPRFANSLVLANTAKVQSDLQTLDAAIVMYEAENGRSPSSLSDLSPYVTDIDNLAPPNGECRLKSGGTIKITAKAYTIDDVAAGDNTQRTQKRALCGELTAGAFGK